MNASNRVTGVSFPHWKVLAARSLVVVAGSFTLSLNTYYCGSNEYYSDPNEWAATIAHEMLHNLGHRHDSSTVAYDSLQIIMLDREVKYNGTFVRNSQAKMADSESLEK